MITTIYVIDFDYYFKVIIDIICERRDRGGWGASERASERARGGNWGSGGGQRGGMRLPSRCRFPGALRANRPGACYACFLFFFCAALAAAPGTLVRE